uniref:PITH domain-containing protein n=1 Tax=Mesocestoides corti TaxID=53468 RepID=A0A5K3ELA0_MESCO
MRLLFLFVGFNFTETYIDARVTCLSSLLNFKPYFYYPLKVECIFYLFWSLIGRCIIPGYVRLCMFQCFF